MQCIHLQRVEPQTLTETLTDVFAYRHSHFLNDDCIQNLKDNQMRQMYMRCNERGEQLHTGPGFYVLSQTSFSAALTIKDFDEFAHQGFDDFVGEDFGDEVDIAEPYLHIDSEFIPGVDIQNAKVAFLSSLRMSEDDMIKRISDMALHSDVHLTYYLVPFQRELSSHEMEVVHDLLRIEGAHHLLTGEETLLFQD